MEQLPREIIVRIPHHAICVLRMVCAQLHRKCTEILTSNGYWALRLLNDFSITAANPRKIYQELAVALRFDTFVTCASEESFMAFVKDLEPSCELFSHASYYGFTQYVEMCLKREDMDILATDECALCVAAQQGNVDIVRLLINDPRVDPADDDNNAICMAAQGGHAEVARLLLADPRVDPAAGENWAILDAAERGHTEVVRVLLADPRVDPAARDNYAIRAAAENGRTEVVRALLADPRVDPAARDNYAIVRAVDNGHMEVVWLLLDDPRVEVDASQTIADKALEMGHVGTLKAVIERGTLNTVFLEELVVAAVGRGDSEMVKMILEFIDGDCVLNMMWRAPTPEIARILMRRLDRELASLF